MREMAAEEVQRLNAALGSNESQLRSLLVPRDPRDEKKYLPGSARRYRRG